MKNYLPIVLFLFATVLYSQKSDNSLAKSNDLNLNNSNAIENTKKTLSNLDLTNINMEDEIDEQNGLPPRFGIQKDVNYNLQNSGVWTVLDNGDRIWQLKIKSQSALSINLLYDQYWLPQGAKLHIYNEDRLQTLGGFTSINNRGSRQNPKKFTTGLIFGDNTIIELFEPSNVQGQSILSIDKVVQGYKKINVLSNVYSSLAVSFGDSGSCQVNINCPEGNNWQEEKKGIALILVNGNRVCTGSLVNNTNEDLTPYFLTADHCIGSLDANSNTDASFYSFYWNYESNSCLNTPDFSPPSTSGATLVANNSNSDFALFRLTESPVEDDIDVYFNGWDRTTSPSQGGVGIHHPRGDFKKIATHNMTPTNGQVWNPNTHWRVNWISTANGYSVTEGGSSGSPLFTNNKRLIGQLHGGSGINCSDPANDPGEYGKFGVSWEGTSPQRRLKDWLDPSNSNQMFLDGTITPQIPCSEIATDFEITGPTTLCSGEQATYTANYFADWSIPSHWQYAYQIISTNTNNVHSVVVECIVPVQNLGLHGYLFAEYQGCETSKYIECDAPRFMITYDDNTAVKVNLNNIDDTTPLSNQGITQVEWNLTNGNSTFLENNNEFARVTDGSFTGTVTLTNSAGSVTKPFFWPDPNVCYSLRRVSRNKYQVIDRCYYNQTVENMDIKEIYDFTGNKIGDIPINYQDLDIDEIGVTGDFQVIVINVDGQNINKLIIKE